MPTNEEDLQAQLERNEELRQKIAEEQAKTAELTAGLQTDITAAQLDAEGVALAARLDELQRENERLANVKPQPLADAEAQMAASVAAAQAAQEAEAARLKAEADAEAERERAEQEAAAQAAAEAAANAENKKGEGN